MNSKTVHDYLEWCRGVEKFRKLNTSAREDFEIRKTKDGRIFGIKNIRQEFEGNTVTYKADIAGDLEAGNEYLKSLAERISKQFTEQQKIKNVNEVEK